MLLFLVLSARIREQYGQSATEQEENWKTVCQAETISEIFQKKMREVKMDNNIGNGRRTKDVLLVVSTILLMLGLIFVTLKPDLFSSKNALFTGLVVSEQSGALDINSTYSIDSVVPLNITEDITSLRLSGTILGTGNVTILLKTDTKQYVIFDTTRSTSNTNSENNGITGLIISDITGNEQTVDTDTDNVTDNNTLVNISKILNIQI